MRTPIFVTNRRNRGIVTIAKIAKMAVIELSAFGSGQFLAILAVLAILAILANQGTIICKPGSSHLNNLYCL